MSKFKVGETYKTRDKKQQYRLVGVTTAGHLVFEFEEGKRAFTRLPDGRISAGHDCWGDLVLHKIIHKRYVHWLRYSQSEAIDCCVHDTRHPEHDHLVKIEEITFEEEQT